MRQEDIHSYLWDFENIILDRTGTDIPHWHRHISNCKDPERRKYLASFPPLLPVIRIMRDPDKCKQLMYRKYFSKLSDKDLANPMLEKEYMLKWFPHVHIKYWNDFLEEVNTRISDYKTDYEDFELIKFIQDLWIDFTNLTSEDYDFYE